MVSSLKNPYAYQTLTWLIQESYNIPTRDYINGVQTGLMTTEQRKKLVRRMFTTSERYSNTHKTTQLAITLVDIILSKKSIKKAAVLEFMGWLILRLAMKYEDGRTIAPSDISQSYQNMHSIENIKVLEVFMIK